MCVHSGSGSRRATPPTAAGVGAAALAWIGFFVHDFADLPGQSLRSPETLYPTVVTIGCVAVLLIRATRTAGAWLLLGWTALCQLPLIWLCLSLARRSPAVRLFDPRVAGPPISDDQPRKG